MTIDPDNLEKGFEPGNEDWVPEPPKPEDKPVLTLAELLATIFSRVCLGLLLFISFIAGVWVAGTCLHDPDTCWLLATGRYIVENHQIPVLDPFSWTFAAQEAAGRHLVCYQWLSEVIFYLASVPIRLVGLCLLCAVTITTAFFSVPMGFVVRRESPFIQSAWVIVLGMMAASFHTLARPEIFSYLLIALYLQNTHDARVSTMRGEQKVFPLVFVLAPLMVLWANMHTGFVSGFAILFALCLGSFLSLLFIKAPVKNLLVSASVAMLGCSIAACINPYGIGLYAYIPELFNSPVNEHIVELQPVIGADLKINPGLYPFLALCLTYLFLMAREIIAYLKSTGEAVERKLLASELLLNLICGTVAIWNGLAHGRVASFVTLILVAEIIALLGHGQARHLKALTAGKSAEEKTAANKTKFWTLLDLHTLDLWKAGGIYEMAIVALCAIAGVCLVSFRITPPVLPAGSIAFEPPVEAVSFIEKNQPAGKLFNDQQYGDMLIYKGGGKPKVFIDTRFDMYGEKICIDYMVINDGEPGWQDLLKKYGIDWVFVRRKSALAGNLKKDPTWETLYEDEKAVIMRQRQK
ncbi:MAG: hypothetical protein KGS72_12520 [Cyanobacteria bacterium REEB67]|nr:hypothetical protein [Cyanobacteria bacterium REEB67]